MTAGTRVEVERILAALRAGDLTCWDGVEQLAGLGIAPRVVGILIRQACEAS